MFGYISLLGLWIILILLTATAYWYYLIRYPGKYVSCGCCSGKSRTPNCAITKNKNLIVIYNFGRIKEKMNTHK